MPLLTVFVASLAVIMMAPACRTDSTPPLPVFTWDIPLPSNETTAAELTLPAGGQAVVPVTLIATREEDLTVNLSMDYEEGFPEGIQVVFSTPYEDISLPAGSQHISKVTFTASRDVPPDVYRTHIVATLGAPVDGIAGIAREIDIRVTDQSH